MKIYNDLYLAVLIILFCSLSAGAVNLVILPDGTQCVANRIVVVTDYAISPETLCLNAKAVAGENAVESCKPFYPGKLKKPALKELADRMFIITTVESANLLTVISDIKNLPFVKSAETQTLPRLHYTPNDPNLDSQWHLDKIRAYEAWDYIRGNDTERAVIAVPDAGINYNHPDISPNIWYNPHEEINGFDDDGNGFIDDYMGWDFADFDNDPNYYYMLEHGTGVAASISEATDNGILGAGVGFSARLMNIKVITDGGQLAEFGYLGLIYAADLDADVINLSWGLPLYRQYEQDIITAAWNTDVLLIAAGGSGDTLEYPAAYEHVMAVSTTDQNDHRAWFAPYGEYIDICAPSVNIALPWGEDFSILSGTSFAAGIVSGVAGLVRAHYLSLTNEQAWQLIVDSADPIDHLNPGYEGLLGAGRVNAARCFTTDIGEEAQLPDRTELVEAYPNPFNAVTTFKYHLSQPTDVLIEIYDLLGRRVDTIEQGYQNPGNQTAIWDAGKFSSGIYFAKLCTNNNAGVIKLTLLK